MADVLQTTNSRSKSFLNFFPVPKFLELSSVGISLSDKSVQLVEFKRKGGSGDLSLLHAVELPLPEGSIIDGFIENKEAVVNVLNQIRSTYGVKFVKSTLPEEKAYLFTTEVDKEPFASLRDRVAFTIEENAPVSLTESIFDFEIIGGVKGKDRLKVAVSVLPTKVVETYLNVFEIAGITVVSFDVESQAIARSVIEQGDERPHLIFYIGDAKAGLYVVENEVVQFSSTFSFGTRLVDGVYTDLQNLKTEARKVFAFWNTRLDKEGIPEKKIEKIILAGHGAIEENFVAQLIAGIDIEYALANVWVNAFSIKEHVPEMPFGDSLSCAAAIGMALPDKPPTYV